MNSSDDTIALLLSFCSIYCSVKFLTVQNVCTNACIQDLLKELEEFAFKGIPDLRGCSLDEPVSPEELVSNLRRHYD
jgi:hypothetical protein